MSEKITLKPCPFCGVTPEIYWESWEEISPSSGAWVLEANHKNGCFIRAINGRNLTGRTTSFNKEFLTDVWNRRTGDE